MNCLLLRRCQSTTCALQLMVRLRRRRKMLLVVNVPPPNNGTAVQNMTVVSNGTSAGTHTQRCSAGYDACFSGCMRSYNLDSDAYQMCCGALNCLSICALH